MEVPWDSYESPVGALIASTTALWKFHWIPTEAPWKSHGSPTGFPRKPPMEVQWKSRGSPSALGSPMETLLIPCKHHGHHGIPRKSHGSPEYTTAFSAREELLSGTPQDWVCNSSTALNECENIKLADRQNTLTHLRGTSYSYEGLAGTPCTGLTMHHIPGTAV